MVMSVATSSQTLIKHVQYEGMSLDLYRVDAKQTHVDMRINGKRVVDAVLTRPRDGFKNIVQLAFDNVFYWCDDTNIRSAEERHHVLEVIQAYWATLSTLQIKPTPSLCEDIEVDGITVRYARFWHPNRLVIRTYCSIVQENGLAAVTGTEHAMEVECKHSVSCELSPQDRPPLKQDVVSTLLAQLRKGTRND